MRINVKIIDTHAHFHDLEWPDGLIWPRPTAQHYRTCLPGDYEYELGRRSVVAIETSTRPVDDLRLAEVARNSDVVVSYVNNMQPLDKGFSQRLERAKTDPKWSGIRLRPIDGYDLKSNELINALAQLEGSGHVELGIRDLFRLEQVNQLCLSLPNVNFVLTHCGHPSFAKQPMMYEYNQLQNLNNLFIKLSTPQDTDICEQGVQEVLLSHIKMLNRILGPERLMFGSNWPGSKNSEQFQEWVSKIFSYNEDHHHAIFCKTAMMLYQINEGD